MSRAKTVIKRTAIRGFRNLPFPIQRRVVRAATPNYTLGAVVLLRDESERLLLVRQPALSGWALPGGLMRKGEEPPAAAARELREEAGVRLAAAELTPASPNAVVYPPIRQVDVVFTATVPADTAVTADNTEVSAVAWFAPAELPKLTMTTARLLSHYGLGPYESVEDANRAADIARKS